MKEQLKIGSVGTKPFQRIVEFDGVRAVAILLIVACHICYGFDNNNPLGQYLGGTFNFVFFVISALLAGISAQGSMNVLTKRKFGNYIGRKILRICPDLWIFLTAFLIVASVFGEHMSLKGVVMNYLMLGWFSKLPHIGHLWFVTMIMMCYICFFYLERFRNSRAAMIAFVLVCVAGQLVLEYMGMPGYMFLILLVCGLCYLYAPFVVSYMVDCKSFVCWGGGKRRVELCIFICAL